MRNVDHGLSGDIDHACADVASVIEKYSRSEV